MDFLFSDLRHGVRTLLRTPLTTGSVVASLALGIATTTTMFAVVEAFLLRPLDAPEPDRILSVYSTNPDRGWTRASMSMPDLADLRGEARTLSLAGYRDWGVNLSGEDEPERLSGLEVTANLFQVLGTEMEIGRSFLPEEEDGARVAVLGNGTWVMRYGADPGVVGSTVRLNGEVFTVVGVLPKAGVLPFNMVQVFIPANVRGGEARTARSWSAVGRLAGGASVEEARAELGRLTEGLERAYPEINAGMRADFVRYRDELFGNEQRTGSITLLVLAWISTQAISPDLC